MSPRLLALTILLAPAAGQTAPKAAPTPAQATGTLLFPLEIVKNRDLDFGNVGTTAAAGTVVINPETDTISSTGGASLLGGTPHAAQFTGAAKGNNVVIIRIPKQPVTLTRVGGTQTMIADNFTLQGLDKRAVAARVAFDFKVGATLNVNANQAEGTYVGTFDVSIQYP
ncbi:MAG TPA: DUF4402 domain-containing protein [Sphingomicrobium sp.]|nr:DUF4402 domain-containing protein [Sphingomicrobium sp.]